MSGFNCSVHFLTLKQVGYEEANVAVTFYHDSTHFDPKHRNLYAEYTEDFNLQQGRQFVLHKRLLTTPSKMTKLKDQIKEFDAIFQPSSDESQASKAAGLFMSSLSSNVAKIVWLSTNRILLIMQDALLVWLLIDTVSGDLIKILIDKTLHSPLGSDGTRLSGAVICDAFLVVKNDPKQPTVLILTYSDKSIVDLVSFNKNSVFIESVTKDTNKLEKLTAFEPSLMSFEFSCPSNYRIEKRLCFNEAAAGLFTLWWPNDGQMAWQPRHAADSQTVSLLERDDLRNNILLLSMSGEDKNLLEYVFKSDGLLLSVSYLSRTSLIALEQTETSTQKYALTFYRYDLPVEWDAKNKDAGGQSMINMLPKSAGTYKIKLTTFNLNAKIASIEQVNIA